MYPDDYCSWTGKVFLFEGGQGHYEREKHWHTSIEIFAVLKGRLTFFLNDEEYPLEAGELIIINSNEIHSIYAPEKNETVVLQIPLKQFEKYFTAQRFIRFTSAARLAKDKNTKAPDNRKLAFFIEELHKVYQAREEGWEYRTMALYYNVLYLMVKDYRLEQAAVELVRSRKPITEIAQRAGYDNASKFSESFKKRYGKTPSRYRADKTNAVKRSIETKTE